MQMLRENDRKTDVLFDPIENFDKVKHICSIFSNIEQPICSFNQRTNLLYLLNKLSTVKIAVKLLDSEINFD